MDYLRSGAMAALSPIMSKVKEYNDQSGLVFGICNGFQILCEAGLLPGALARNRDLRFICKDSTLKVVNQNSPWTNEIPENSLIQIPIAHGDGRYMIDEEGLKSLQDNKQILLEYVENPNGSIQNIAGIMNKNKNVFGLMPHPDRAADLRSHDGMKIWNSLVHHVKGNQ
jgi:phosphoribosylformylglycinamidine synthase